MSGKSTSSTTQPHPLSPAGYLYYDDFPGFVRQCSLNTGQTLREALRSAMINLTQHKIVIFHSCIVTHYCKHPWNVLRGLEDTTHCRRAYLHINNITTRCQNIAGVPGPWDNGASRCEQRRPFASHPAYLEHLSLGRIRSTLGSMSCYFLLRHLLLILHRSFGRNDSLTCRPSNNPACFLASYRPFICLGLRHPERPDLVAGMEPQTSPFDLSAFFEICRRGRRFEDMNVRLTLED